MEYVFGQPSRITSVVVSCQHDSDKDMEMLRREIQTEVIQPALWELPPDEGTEILINPSGRFVLGGFEADTGLTGRKLMVDTYGGLAPHGGGALSGKDGSKVDRSGTYMARYIAKNIVAAGLAEKCTVSLAYSKAFCVYALLFIFHGWPGAGCHVLTPCFSFLRSFIK